MTVRGAIRAPGDKSITHRALMLSALASGRSRIEGALVADDTETTARVLRALGAPVPAVAAAMDVEGRGVRGLTAPNGNLECRNSGTTARLIAGIVAGHPFSARFTGDSSLSRRPMRRVARPLEAMGAHVAFAGTDGLPMTVRGGTLQPVDWTLESESAQVKSAILLAGLTGHVRVSVSGGGGSRDHTERLLTALGAKVESRAGDVVFEPPEALEPLRLIIPSDPSSSAYFAALAGVASAGELELVDVCLNTTRTRFFELLGRMGADVTVEKRDERGGEDVGTIRVRPGALRGVVVPGGDAAMMLDELPLLAAVAAVAEGETTVTGAEELRVKESDRVATTVANLRAVGVDADELPDGFVVRGSRKPLRGRVTTHADHRIAMAFGVLAVVPGNRIAIDDPGCVAVSYPGFWADLKRVRA